MTTNERSYLADDVGGKWSVNAIWRRGLRAGTYGSLQMHIIGRFRIPTARSFLDLLLLCLFVAKLISTSIAA